MNEEELDRQQEVELGYRASELMHRLNPYFEAMEERLITGVMQCPVGDVDTLHHIKLQLHALTSLKSNIESVIMTGTLASIELEGTVQ